MSSLRTYCPDLLAAALVGNPASDTPIGTGGSLAPVTPFMEALAPVTEPRLQLLTDVVPLCARLLQHQRHPCNLSFGGEGRKLVPTIIVGEELARNIGPLSLCSVCQQLFQQEPELHVGVIKTARLNNTVLYLYGRLVSTPPKKTNYCTHNKNNLFAELQLRDCSHLSLLNVLQARGPQENVETKIQKRHQKLAHFRATDCAKQLGQKLNNFAKSNAMNNSSALSRNRSSKKAYTPSCNQLWPTGCTKTYKFKCAAKESPLTRTIKNVKEKPMENQQ
jgi:hypothetical protein